MSAIAGVRTHGAAPEPGVACARMLAAQAIYGPHACDQWNGGPIALGRRLFRTLPEDAFDRQPLISDDGRHVLVADVRLDNRGELERELSLPPSHAGEMCDAALLLAAWRRWERCVFDRLVGDYAFAVWDDAHGTLTLARDPVGQRPLHYHRAPGFFAFASMPKGLHALDETPRAPDLGKALDFLALMPEHGPASFFAGVERVEPGGVLTVSAERVRVERHWNPPRRPILFAKPHDYVEAAREHLDRAVAAQLRGAEKRVAAHLSAGLDSAGVVATAARLLARSGGRIFAFTAVPRKGFAAQSTSGRLVDEGELAAATAGLYPNVEHIRVPSSGRSPAESLDRDHFVFDRPVLNLCNNIWVADINRLARDQGLTVLLNGMRGNLSLSYDGIDLLSELLARGRLAAWFRVARRVVAAGTRRWRGVARHSLGPWIPGRLWQGLEGRLGIDGVPIEDYTALNPAVLRGLDYEGRSAALGMDPFWRPCVDNFAFRLAMLGRVDSGNYNKGVLGGWGLDFRDPTADRRLIEFCLNIPTEQYLADGRPRCLARRTLADRVPESVLNEPRHGRQGADWFEGMGAHRGEVADWIGRLGECAPAAEAVDLPRLEGLIAAWPEDGLESKPVETAYRSALLRGLSVGHFLHRASGSNR